MPRIELPPPPWIIGHRGAAGEACENTLAAFRRGQDSGVDMIEFDVQLASDGVPVCFHDWELDRLAGRDEVVEDERSDVLTGIELGDANTTMPTLATALTEIPEPMPLNVELKRRRASGGSLARAVLDALDGRTQVLISSFDWALLEIVRELAPKLPLAPLSAPSEIRALADDPAGDLIATGETLGAFSLHCSRSMIEQSLVTRAAERGFEHLVGYTVNDVAEAERFFAYGVAGIFTDFPTAMVSRFREADSRTEIGEATT